MMNNTNTIDKDAMPTDAEILDAFKNTNFGRTDYKAILIEGVRKTATGYHNGWTLTQIIRGLGLGRVSSDHEKNLLTDKGLKFIEQAAYECCLSEFEQVGEVQESFSQKATLTIKCDDVHRWLKARNIGTPLFTRKG